MADSSLIHGLHAYSAWRAALRERIQSYHAWLTTNELGDAQTSLRVQQMLDRLEDDRLVVAVVAELSRGKSELINAIFFADYGRRLLPASSGRSTTCTTELQYDRRKQPGIELLPIQTRARHASSFEFKRFPEEWHVLPLDLASEDAMRDAFAQVRDTIRITADEARRYGLFGLTDGPARLPLAEDGTVEVPRWRHAVINFPHPLLEQGLVILDTPGLDAPAAETGFDLQTLPEAHVVMLILGADAGVGRPETDLWRERLASGAGRCLAVLNKIDVLWTASAGETQQGLEISRHVDRCARALGVEGARVFAVSAQKGLEAKRAGDRALLDRSGLPLLEDALATALIGGRHEIMGAIVRRELSAVAAATGSRLDARRRNILEQLRELEYLRGKNRSMVGVMMQKVGAEKENLERELSSYQALRGVFSAHSNRLFTHLGMDALSEDWRVAREQMRSSVFTAGVRSAMARFFRNVREGMERSLEQVTEISTLMAAMYRKFSEEHGSRLSAPAPFSMLKYLKEIDRLEAIYERRFNTLMAMLVNGKQGLMQKFFETLARRVKRCYEYANREADQWLRAIMAPMETQVTEHQAQFMRRLESIKRIHRAIRTLEERMEELLALERNIRVQIDALSEMTSRLDQAIDAGQIPLARAA